MGTKQRTGQGRPRLDSIGRIVTYLGRWWDAQGRTAVTRIWASIWTRCRSSSSFCLSLSLSLSLLYLRVSPAYLRILPARFLTHIRIHPR
ncbi:hypothetical protein LX36DRAFT_462507 [Colletotrichum falcatum]|nr:hypothetical protein LX36DRAFT_462507 [Colletotrichum falcatum]